MDYLIRRRQLTLLSLFISLVAFPCIISTLCLSVPYFTEEAFLIVCPGTILLLSLFAIYPFYYYTRDRAEYKKLEATLMGPRFGYLTYSPEEWAALADAARAAETERHRQDLARFDSPAFIILHNTVLILCLVVLGLDLLSKTPTLSPVLLPLLFLLAVMNAFRLEPLRIAWRHRNRLRDSERSIYIGRYGLVESWGRFVPFRTKTRRLSLAQLEKSDPAAQSIVLLARNPKKKGAEAEAEQEFYRLPLPRKQLQTADGLVESFDRIISELD
jgi:hypothetical protein